ncbi:MAG: DUF559 domain-containing protein, partial [Flavobacteriales bacterium]|nr:DUF559 domain-containing protein [Flavobacteriales bacterium]
PKEGKMANSELPGEELQKEDQPEPTYLLRGDLREAKAFEHYGYETADSKEYNRLKTFAAEQKANPTEAEKALWERLRNKQLGGHKFRRQHIIDVFIADFICLKQRLIVEVDGGIHHLPEVKFKDEDREKRLNILGFRVIRFTNKEVLGDIDRVLGGILEVLNLAPPSPPEGGGIASPQPPPKEGEMANSELPGDGLQKEDQPEPT